MHEWLGTGGERGEPTFGRFLFVLLGSLSAGLVVSALRWAAIDTIHHKTGVRPPALDYRKLPEKVESFLLIVEANDRYYQFYANLFLALPIAAACWVSGTGNFSGPLWLLGVLVEAVLFVGSRDSLRRFYDRAGAILGERCGAGASSLDE